MAKELKFYENGRLKTECELYNGEKHGKFVLYHENGSIAIESHYIHGKNEGLWREWYESGRLAEEGEYVDGNYIVKNFWDEGGLQLLINGTGKTIRKFGYSEGDIYEQYFQNYEFKGEKKIAGVRYGPFIPNDPPESSR